MKTEPTSYSIDDLKRDGKTCWSGVRNYQARNFMRDEMQLGDGVLFYHSNADPAGVAGMARVCKTSHPDVTQWDKTTKYYDPTATKENPRWFLVDIEFVKKFDFILPLEVLRGNPRLKDMMVLKRGSRLSVQPVSSEHFNVITKMAGI